MTITYRTAGAWGAGSGANLPAATVDNNFYDLDVRVTYLEDNPPQANGIADISVVADQMTITLDDHTHLGPFTLPVTELSWQGDWLPNHTYLENDIFSEDGALYHVKLDHVSPASFDPGYNLGSGLDVYQKWLEQPSDVLPTGGDEGDVLIKTDSVHDFRVHWETKYFLPAGGFSGQILRKHSGTNGDATWEDEIGTIDQQGDYVLNSPRDAGDVLMWNGHEWTNERVQRSFSHQISETDLLAHTTQYIVAPTTGRIIGLWIVIQKDVSVGGNVELVINGTSFVTVPVTASAAGNVYFSLSIADAFFNAGDLIKLNPTSFGTAGSLNVQILWD